LQENFERNVMWYLKENASLADTKNNSTRLPETFRLTEVSRNLLAFQVLFLDIARPSGMKLKEITDRYDTNFGQPTTEMETAMKAAGILNALVVYLSFPVKQIKAVKDYPSWFKIIKVEYPGDEKFATILANSVDAAQGKQGYFQGGGGGGGRGGRGGGGGGRGGKRY
jgi:uncharacterized membrane protein YgcG